MAMESKKNSVLVVDDDLTLLDMAEEILSPFYRVSLAKSGEQALNLLGRGGVPDVILLDIEMPRLDGYETLERIRRLKDAADVPVLFLTGVIAAEAEVKALRLGADDYITKPFDREILLARLALRVENAREKKRLQTQLNRQKEIAVDAGKLEQMERLLSDTELKVAQLALLGYANAEIAQKLGYSYNYVKKVLTRVFEKLHIAKRSEIRPFFTA